MRAALLLVVVACQFGDNEIEIPDGSAGYSSEISGCCDYFNPAAQAASWLTHHHGLPNPEVCLRDHTAPGECRWLSCLDGIQNYNVCVPPEDP
jgi:hypothetical protein